MIKEEAIEILSDMRAEYNIFSDDEEEATRYHALSWAIQALNEQQRTGRWIIKDNPKIRWYRVTCSECGEDVTSVIPLIGFFPNVKALWDFCPHCGAKMEVEE